MQCPECKQELRIAKTSYGVKEGKPYCFQDMVCINKRCTNYTGEDLNQPAKIIQTLEHDLSTQ